MKSIKNLLKKLDAFAVPFSFKYKSKDKIWFNFRRIFCYTVSYNSNNSCNLLFYSLYKMEEFYHSILYDEHSKN